MAAKKNGQKAEMAQCHQNLAYIYEEQGNYQEALAHQKAYHTLHEEIAGEQASTRLAILSVVYQIEAAQKETEIYRLKAEQLHREAEEQRMQIRSQEQYRIVADYTYDWGYWRVPDGAILYMSPSCERITGYTASEFVENPALLEEIVLPEDRPVLDHHKRVASDNALQDVLHKVEFRIRRRDGEIRWIGHVCQTIRKEDGSNLGLRATNRDITERKQVERLDHFRVELWEYSASHSLQKLMQMALDEICALTNSPIGFYHFVEDDQKTLTLQAWSSRTQEEFCKAEGQGLHYDIDQAGVWVDAFHQRKPVIHNDYAALPHRKGLPDGHAEVVRQLVVPVLRENRVVSLLGVGNKASDYDENDTQLVSTIADLVWTIVSNKLAEEKLRQAQEQLAEQQRGLAKAEERQRMARDLHDSVSQSIHSMVLFSETLAATLEKNNMARAKRIMSRLQESARQSNKETRLLLYELQAEGPGRRVNLVADLEDRLAKVELRAGVRAQVIQEGSLEFCPPEWQENLFWIAIEALNNAIKHAQARIVKITIRSHPDQITLEVRDNGIGFDTSKEHIGRMGLDNMRARADIINGTLMIDSEPGKGTIVRFVADLESSKKE